jgi:hypothetical protein
VWYRLHSLSKSFSTLKVQRPGHPKQKQPHQIYSLSRHKDGFSSFSSTYPLQTSLQSWAIMPDHVEQKNFYGFPSISAAPQSQFGLPNSTEIPILIRQTIFCTFAQQSGALLFTVRSIPSLYTISTCIECRRMHRGRRP